jgi:hypothetical protein
MKTVRNNLSCVFFLLFANFAKVFLGQRYFLLSAALNSIRPTASAEVLIEIIYNILLVRGPNIGGYFEELPL